MGKHAYLIIAHKDDLTYRTLLRLLDDPRNDIFVHMDIKNVDYDVEKVNNYIQNGRIVHTKRTNVTWGGYSQINAELLLLEYATLGNIKYDYYHLISGQDLPIKGQDYIHEFFNRNLGKEFITFDSDSFNEYRRVGYYRFFQEYIGRKSNGICRKCDKFLMRVQKLFKIKRNSQVVFRKGTNWFSITDDLAHYVISQKKIYS